MKKSPEKSIHFPISQTIKMAVLSLKIRWQRSLLLAISLVLAISFFAYTVETIMICKVVVKTGEDASLKYKSIRKLCPSGTKTPSRDLWLIAMSLLICLAGITNAQLMAVTERFREIGTLKCLGALDRFIVNLLVVETCIYGLFGGIIGGLLGMITAVISFLLKAGGIGLSGISLNIVSAPIGLSVLVSIGLSMLGAIYPAIIAARMTPSVALRYEE
ncbi:MAG: FtsX-like permease family protein [Thermodesulforhabdaceae bacterium]